MHPVPPAVGVGTDGALLKRTAYVAAGWAWLLAIVWLSVSPQPPRLDLQEGDKLQHLAAYGLLMIWFALLYARTRTRVAYAIAFVAMGVALEYVQRALGYRSFDVADMVANGAGVLAGWALGAAMPRILPR